MQPLDYRFLLASLQLLYQLRHQVDRSALLTTFFVYLTDVAKDVNRYLGPWFVAFLLLYAR